MDVETTPNDKRKYKVGKISRYEPILEHNIISPPFLKKTFQETDHLLHIGTILLQSMFLTKWRLILQK